MREQLREWMKSRVQYYNNGAELGRACVRANESMIGKHEVDSFVWDDAQAIWDAHHLKEQSARYA